MWTIAAIVALFWTAGILFIVSFMSVSTGTEAAHFVSGRRFTILGIAATAIGCILLGTII